MSRQTLCIVSSVLWLHLFMCSYGQVHIGCLLKSNVTNKRQKYFDNSLTHEICISECDSEGYAFAGLSDGFKCFCYESSIKDIYSPVLAITTWACYDDRAIRCSGNQAQYCGAEDVNLVFSLCPLGKHGASCSSSCSCSGKACKYNGGCVDECWLGTGGLSGCTACVSGKFGPHCAFSCPSNCRSTCNAQTGKCPQPCSSGKGDYCLDTCQPGKWGVNCEDACSSNCENQLCDHTSGNCTNGCSIKTQWGNMCQTQCSRSCVSSECEQATGSCSKGCVEGQYGDRCLTACPVNCTGSCDRTSGNCTNGCVTGTWRSRCSETCPLNCVNEQCDQDSGKCLNGCLDGYHGETCNKPCPENCHTKTCDWLTGECDGCLDGWTGKTCNATCAEECRTCDQEAAAKCKTCKDGFCMDGDQCTEPPCVQLTTLIGDSNPTKDPVAIPVIPIAAGAAGGGVVLIIIVIIVIVFVKRREQPQQLSNDSQAALTPTERPVTSVENVDYDAVDVQPSPSQASPPPQQSILPPYQPAPSPPRPAPPPQPAPITRRPPPANKTFTPVKEVSVDNLTDHISQTTDTAFKKEYKCLPKGKTKPWERAETCSTKNRFSGLYAYDHSRVRLSPLPIDENADYINANYLPNYDNPKAFIAAQGPHTAETCNDFIRMIWEQNVKTIVVTAKDKEAGKNGKLSMKFIPYWPLKKHEQKDFGDITVTLQSEIVLTDYTIRTLVLSKDGRSHEVNQFHLMCWPDQGVPTSTVPLLNFHRRVRHSIRDNGGDGPIIVHCSAGIGRTGTYIALDALLRQAKHEAIIDVQGCIKRLREDRVDMVQTTDQYKFIYNALNEALKLGQTTIECNVIDKVLNTWKTRTPSPIDKQFELLESLKLQLGPNDNECAMSDENKCKNRFRNVLAAGEYRVVLKREATQSDYINAIYVHGYKKQCAFHVTQMPMDNTVEDFWQLVWDNKYPVIVALLMKEETGARWCPSESKPLSVGGREVRLLNSIAKHRHIMEMAMTIQTPTETESDELYENFGTSPQGLDTGSHKLTLFWVHQANARSLWQAYEATQRIMADTPDLPVAVMCLDGCQNCGLYAASHNLLDMVTTEQEFDVFDTVRQLRHTRPQFIIDKGQYQTLYQVIEAYLKK